MVVNNDTAANNISTTLVMWFDNPAWVIYIWNVFVWLFPTLCLAGGLINILCFFVTLCHSRAFPFATRLFMLIISGSDVLTLLFRGTTYYLTQMSSVIGHGSWSWYNDLSNINLPLCMLHRFITFYALYGASFFQLGLTIDRLIAVTLPLQAKFILTRKRICALIFVLSIFALTFPMMETFNTTWISSCAPLSEEFNMITVQLELFVGRLALGSILLVFTFIICVAVIRASRQAPSDANAAKRSMDAVRLSFTLVFLNLNFLAFSLPWSIVNTFPQRVPVNRAVKNIFTTLLYMNSVFNWIAYFIGRRFRGYFACTFGCQRCHLHRQKHKANY